MNVSVANADIKDVAVMVKTVDAFAAYVTVLRAFNFYQAAEAANVLSHFFVGRCRHTRWRGDERTEA